MVYTVQYSSLSCEARLVPHFTFTFVLREILYTKSPVVPPGERGGEDRGGGERRGCPGEEEEEEELVVRLTISIATGHDGNGMEQRVVSEGVARARVGAWGLTEKKKKKKNHYAIDGHLWARPLSE